jgi:hypothetical protein
MNQFNNLIAKAANGTEILGRVKLEVRHKPPN